MRRVVRTRINAAWLGEIRAEITRRRFLPHLSARFERMQRNVAVGTIFRAQAAADAPILDDHFKRIPAPDRPDRAPDHTQWIAALPARCCDKIIFITQSLADQTSDSIVRVGAGADAL